MSADPVKIEVLGIHSDQDSHPRQAEGVTLNAEVQVVRRDDGEEVATFQVTDDNGATPKVNAAELETPSGDLTDDKGSSTKLNPAALADEGDATGTESELGDASEAAQGQASQSEPLSQPQEEEEEEEECGFCIFMKQGPCGKRFSLWQNCVEGAEKSEKDIVQECAQVTTLLKVCMEMNPQYYGPILDAEKAMEAEVDIPQEDVADGGEGDQSGGSVVEAENDLEGQVNTRKDSFGDEVKTRPRTFWRFLSSKKSKLLDLEHLFPLPKSMYRGRVDLSITLHV